MNALEFAQLCVAELGHVIVDYDDTSKIGQRTSIIWREHLVPATFVVLRPATPEEVAAFADLCRRNGLKYDRSNAATHPHPMILVTD